VLPACSSTGFVLPGLEAVNQAASRIAAGWEDLILAGGIESMSRVPMGASGGAWLQGPEISLVGNERIGKELGLEPRARIVAVAVPATDPIIMLSGPGPAAKKCLAKAGMTIADIDLFENGRLNVSGQR
jgi:acetyl-CoA C-acetyltransferase